MRASRGRNATSFQPRLKGVGDRHVRSLARLGPWLWHASLAMETRGRRRSTSAWGRRRTYRRAVGRSQRPSTTRSLRVCCCGSHCSSPDSKLAAQDSRAFV
jgi:hypothetical protein